MKPSERIEQLFRQDILGQHDDPEINETRIRAIINYLDEEYSKPKETVYKSYGHGL